MSGRAPWRSADFERTIEKRRDAFVVEVAGLSACVSNDEPSLRILPGKASRPFLRDTTATGTEANVTLRVRFGDTTELEAGNLIFDSGGVWKLFTLRDGSSCFRFHDARSRDRPYKVLVLGSDRAEGEIVLDPEVRSSSEPVDPLEFPLDELLFLTLLGQKGGVELHACGVKAPDGRGFLFLGHSGDGKTTMARLWESVPGAIVLSDDRVVVRETPTGRWWMYGTPWHGEAELAANVQAEVAALFVLERGERNAMQPLLATEAVAALLARSFPPFHAPEAMQKLLGELDRFVQAVPVARFAVRPGPEAAQTILALPG